MLLSLLSKRLHVLLDRLPLTWQDVHVAVLGDIAGLFGLFHGVPRENSGDALKAETNDVICQCQRPINSNSREPFTLWPSACTSNLLGSSPALDFRHMPSPSLPLHCKPSKKEKIPKHNAPQKNTN